jgi:hypothetical protein
LNSFTSNLIFPLIERGLPRCSYYRAGIYARVRCLHPMELMVFSSSSKYMYEDLDKQVCSNLTLKDGATLLRLFGCLLYKLNNYADRVCVCYDCLDHKAAISLHPLYWLHLSTLNNTEVNEVFSCQYFFVHIDHKQIKDIMPKIDLINLCPQILNLKC